MDGAWIIVKLDYLSYIQISLDELPTNILRIKLKTKILVYYVNTEFHFKGLLLSYLPTFTIHST